MITLHNLENSQSIRIIWLMEELGAEYEIKHYGRSGPNGLAPDDLKKLHPMGTSPTITDGDLTLVETNAIVDYILDQNPKSALRPKAGSAERVPYLYWLHAAQGSFQPLLTDTLVFKRLIAKTPFVLRPLIRLVLGKAEAVLLKPRLAKILGLAEETLCQSRWLAGEKLTAADIVMGYCLEVAEVRIGFDGKYPAIEGFLKRMRARPHHKQAMFKNGLFEPIVD